MYTMLTISARERVFYTAIVNHNQNTLIVYFYDKRSRTVYNILVPPTFLLLYELSVYLSDTSGKEM